MSQGKCIIISAPSGAGKTTIVKQLIEDDLGLEFSISACSRPKRETETDGKDYYFLSVEAFKEKISTNAFVEWQEVYPGSYYGTLHSELDRIWKAGHHVIFDVDVYGGINLKRIFGIRALSVFIMPPSVEVLAQRLQNRASDSAVSLKSRLDKAKLEISKSGEFDIQVVNDVLETAIAETREKVKYFLET